MKFNWPISKKIILTAFLFGAATLTIVEMGFLIPVIGSTVHTDPRELLVTVGAALTGPIGGIIIGLMSIPWFGEITTSLFSTLTAHVCGGLFVGITYKKLVYQRTKLPRFFFGWIGLVIVYYYLVMIPVYILTLSTLNPASFTQTFGDISLWNIYTTLLKAAAPEMIITAVITSIILAALPPKYRCPLWCHYDSSKIAAKNNYLAIRLMIWFLILSALPLATVAIFVLNSVESGFDQLSLEHQKKQTRLLATALANVTAPQSISLIHAQYGSEKYSFNIIDLNGQYLFHPDRSLIGASIKTDFDKESAALILSQKTDAFLDESEKRIIGYAGINGQDKIVVTSSNTDFATNIVASIYHTSQVQLAISFFIIAIIGGIAIWLVVGRPVRHLTHFAQQVGAGNLDIQLKPGEAVDELEVLSSAFNEMAGQLRNLIKGLQEKVIELEETEHRLVDSENQYRSLNDNIPVGVFRTSPEGKVISSNPALLQMVSVEEKNDLDTLNANTFYENPEDRLAFLTEIQSKKQINGFECLFKRNDGTTFLASISARSIAGEDGQIVYIDGVVEDITDREQARQEQKASEAMLRTLFIRLQEVEEANRKEISRELHDRVGQSLTALNINLNILLNQLQPEQLEKVNARIVDSVELVEETTINIRDVMAELRPQVLDDYGLAAALRWYRKHFAKRTGIKVAIETETIDDTRFPEAIETALFRITQEALNNVAKHAQAETVAVAAVSDAGFIYVTINDDGQGFDAKNSRSSADLQQENSQEEFHSWGLMNMRERAEALGGNFQIESELGTGTLVTIEIPIQMEKKDDQRISG